MRAELTSYQDISKSTTIKDKDLYENYTEPERETTLFEAVRGDLEEYTGRVIDDHTVSIEIGNTVLQGDNQYLSEPLVKALLKAVAK